MIVVFAPFHSLLFLYSFFGFLVTVYFPFSYFVTIFYHHIFVYSFSLPPSSCFLFACSTCSRLPLLSLVASSFNYFFLSINHFSLFFPSHSLSFLFSPSSSLPLAANPERGGPFCGGWGQVDAMWPRRAPSPHRAGPQPGVTDGFFLLFSSAVKHRRTWWNQPAAVQGGETAVTRSGGFLLAWLL